MASKEIPPYEPRTIEPKWQRAWEDSGQNRAVERADKPKFYLLEMLPYPSGDLHVGHARNYTLGDVIGRFLRMRGFNVLHPMGWDAFGLPAENAAIQRGIQPRVWTESNIGNMRRQVRMLGTSYDWTREVDTSDPEYYRWTQWLFLSMYRRGLAYKKEAPVNWCPVDKTVLANEQAEGGVCWRCGSVVERRLLNQWFFKITAYADALLAGIDHLDGWPERVRTMQRNWIGRSEGVTFSFAVEGLDESISVFTTRLDTVYGATFIAIAAEHPLVEEIIRGTSEANDVRAFVAATKDRTELERTMEKQGVFSGAYALHPLTGERVPIWVTNYVLATYGSGAVMGVPAHDQRDLEFAHAHGLRVATVIVPVAGGHEKIGDTSFVDDGVLVDSGEFSGLTSEQARKAIAELLIERGVGEQTVNYKLRDWLISRQRYWGAPIPFVNCPNHGLVPVADDALPVRLPDDAPFTGVAGSPLEHVPSFMNTTCPLGDGPATREHETMDTFMCSSWYYLRYLDAHDDEVAWRVDLARYWAPIDQYIGGAEHAVLHLLYSRFFYKVLAEEGLVPGDEPFTRLFNQGSVLGENGLRMSKSRGNVVGIDETVERYGADALRMFEMFAGPPDADFPWSTAGIAGVTRTLASVWRLVLGNAEAVAREGPRVDASLSADESDLRFVTHSTIKSITDEFEGRRHLNTCVSSIMKLLNAVEKYAAGREDAASSPAFCEGLRMLLLLLAPFAPHIAEELWERTGHRESIHLQRWPGADEAALRRDAIEVVVQVNGKWRGVVEVPPGSTEDAVLEKAMTVSTVAAQIDGKSVRKKIFVPDRLLNIVVG
ncbi:MAG TPA: leucine--tRNA ligase [Candidatus Eremiobacteraceae bacterium]|nr:leucine--tRNA ligase [Candidatus Eremiobacteraceae bacterium]